MQNNDKNRRREETDMNNHSHMQTSSTQGHTINNIPNNQEHKGIIKKNTNKRMYRQNR